MHSSLPHDASPSDVVPPIVHFVFGFRPQTEPFHLLHYVALESCRRVLRPERILLHCHHLPYGSYWDLIRPHLTLVPVAPAAEVLATDYSGGVPAAYRYAHHADVVRLDALVAHGGIYADIDTIFLRPLPPALLARAFVIGEEGEFPDERTGVPTPSLCNALMIARPDAPFARAWRARLGAAMDGTWNAHSGFLAHRLARERPDEVHVEPAASFFPERCTPAGVARLLEGPELALARSYSLHLWAHVWWDAQRRDFSAVHAGMFTPRYVRTVDTALNRLLRPYLPEVPVW